MIRLLVACGALVAAVWTIARLFPAQAETRACAPLPMLEAELAARFGERLHALGWPADRCARRDCCRPSCPALGRCMHWGGLPIDAQGKPAPFHLRLYVNPTRRSWTIVDVRLADGCAAIEAAGLNSAMADEPDGKF